MRLWFVPLAASMVFAQTQVDLKSQSRNVDFSGASAVKPVPVGTTLPATCSTGAMFFKSDGLPGANLYACIAANTWILETGGGGSGSAEPAITDLASSLSGTTLTVATGRVNFIINGLPVTFSLGPATISTDAGSDTGSFLVFVDYNAGAPVLRCVRDGGINIGNYTVSSNLTGSTCSAGTSFPANSVPVAVMDVSAGIPQNPVDQRGFLTRAPLTAGAGVTIAGNVISATGGSAGGLQRISFGSLPGCDGTNANTSYLFTDGAGITAHCDGTTFAYFYSSQPVTLPGVASGFTTVNATGGSAISDDKGGLYVHAAAGTGDNLVTALKPLSGATDIRAGVVFGSGGGDYNLCGLVLADGTLPTNQVTLFGRQAQTNGWAAEILHYSNYAADASATEHAAAGQGPLTWLRVVISGASHTFYVSADGGQNWEQFGTETAFETATHYGIGCDARGSSTAAGMFVASLKAQ